MGEPVKELMDNLDKIVQTCKDIPRVIEIGCRGGRNKSYQLMLIDAALQMATSEREINPEKIPRVLIVGSDSSFKNFEQWDVVKRVLEANLIQVEFVNMTLGSMGSLNDKYKGVDSYPWNGELPGLTKHFDIEKVLSIRPVESYRDELLHDLVQQQTFKHHDRKIPIQGKSSKKGKNNPQCGSKFHR